ncbi:HAD-superfamily hydrolase, subfamily IA, variant 3 [Salinispora tropica CNB-440]|uniref:HAD-superfamily hydrolase, subfamily IA, variant 3 n=1 Tax=Salinispora tropica (strain ATCC BAA-916 / DSM 44818 / JCM 13857 / NBRC 105044 / CNB-440) TaxID=369723 RepID=A4X2U7_SALTO|nr:HAD-superfamily hydrolase, subfamily IA, variant 3 [Salinispora tropica CNB-440]
MPRIQAVLFDFFGTLTRAVQRGSAHRTMAELLGCPPEVFVKVLDRTYYQRATGALGTAEATLRWVCEQAGVRPSTAALRSAVIARFRAIRADTRLRTEAVPTLAALRQRGLRIGLVSDCTHELPAFLPQLPIDPLLDVRVLSVQFGRCKPDPELYRAACRQLGLTPAACLYVGDGGSQELTGAERAGLHAVRLAAPDLAGHLTFNPDAGWTGPELTSLAGVVDVIDRADAGPPRMTDPDPHHQPAEVSAVGRGAAGTAYGLPEPPPPGEAAGPATWWGVPSRPADRRRERGG